MDRPITENYWYLGTVFTNFPGGEEKAVDWAHECFEKCLGSGLDVFCPIVHNHSRKINGKAPFNKWGFQEWMLIDKVFMYHATGLIIAQSAGMDTSRGLAFEEGYFNGQGKPIVMWNTLKPVKQLLDKVRKIEKELFEQKLEIVEE